MATAATAPSAGATHGEIIRCAFGVINTHDIFVMPDGIVASNFVVFDQMQFARQIGMLPPDGSAADRATKAAFNARTRVASELRARLRRR